MRFSVGERWLCQKNQGGMVLIKKESIEICRKAQFQRGRTKLTPPLWWSLALSPDSCYVRNVCGKSVRSHWGNLPEIFLMPKETSSSHGCSVSSWMRSGWRRWQHAAILCPFVRAANEPTKRRGFLRVISITSPREKGKNPLSVCAPPAVDWIWRQECSKSMFAANKLSRSDREVSATQNMHLAFCHFPDDLVLPRAFCRQVQLSLIPGKDATGNTNTWRVRML